MEENIDLFYQYFISADIVYRDNVCLTDLNRKAERYDIAKDEIEDACANPNRTFSVLFKNGKKHIFELYITRPHYHSTDSICLRI